MRQRKLRRGFLLVEELCLLGTLLGLVLGMITLLFYGERLYAIQSLRLATKVLVGRIAFVQTKVRYLPTQRMTLTLEGDKEQQPFEPFEKEAGISLPLERGLSAFKLTGPAIFVPSSQGTSGKGLEYELSYRALPSYSRKVCVQPITGRLVVRR